MGGNLHIHLFQRPNVAKHETIPQVQQLSAQYSLACDICLYSVFTWYVIKISVSGLFDELQGKNTSRFYAF